MHITEQHQLLSDTGFYITHYRPEGCVC